jgi:hypothetical protein
MNEETEVAMYNRYERYLCYSIEIREDSNSDRGHKPDEAWSYAIQ